jgi:A/G-specific adenine glycosylase
VMALCQTRGEHVTLKPAKQKQRKVAHVLVMRVRKGRTEVLLEQRAQEASLMAGMFELPPLPLDAVVGMQPDLRVRHAITNTMYAVEVFRSSEDFAHLGVGLVKAIPAAAADLHWAAVGQLGMLPLTGLARKCLVRMGVMEVP